MSFRINTNNTLLDLTRIRQDPNKTPSQKGAEMKKILRDRLQMVEPSFWQSYWKLAELLGAGWAEVDDRSVVTAFRYEVASGKMPAEDIVKRTQELSAQGKLTEESCLYFFDEAYRLTHPWAGRVKLEIQGTTFRCHEGYTGGLESCDLDFTVKAAESSSERGTLDYNCMAWFEVTDVNGISLPQKEFLMGWMPLTYNGTDHKNLTLNFSGIPPVARVKVTNVSCRSMNIQSP